MQITTNNNCCKVLGLTFIFKRAIFLKMICYYCSSGTLGRKYCLLNHHNHQMAVRIARLSFNHNIMNSSFFNDVSVAKTLVQNQVDYHF